jgi:hypothetical protein
MLQQISTYPILKNKDQTDLIKSIELVTNDLPNFVYKQLTQQISTENATNF